MVEISHLPRACFKDDAKEPVTDTKKDAIAFSEEKYNNDRTPNKNLRARSPAYPKPFPINNLAPRQQNTATPISSFPLSPISSVASVASTLTTDSEEEPDDSNEMEWTPTRPSFSTLQPMKPLNSLEDRSTTPGQFGQPRSLFQNHLSGGPFSGSNGLQSFQPHRASSQWLFSNQSAFRDRAAGKWKLPPDNETNSGMTRDKSRRLARRTSNSWMQLAESKLKLPETISDTGLEPLFETIFSIGDDPPEIKTKPEAAEDDNKTVAGDKIISRALLATVATSVIFGALGVAIQHYW